MFEKEAEKWTIDYVCKDCSRYKECKSKEHCTCKDCSKEKWQNGAEFGYNKCKEELNHKGLALQSDMDKTIEQNIALKKELNKANEWHYIKDVNCYEDLHFPFEEEKDRVLIWKVQVITEQRIMLPACYHCGSYDDLWYEINAYHVIAWREITIPKEE